MTDTVAKTNAVKKLVAKLRLLTRRQIAIASVAGIIVVVAAWYLIFATVADTSPPLPPTAAERFEEFFKLFQPTDEVVAKIDDFNVDDDMLQKLASLDRLTTIQVEADSVSLETIVKLAAMPKLEQLHLRGAAIDDPMLATLATSSTIWLLNLPVANVSPEAIEGLGKMPALRQLRLGIQDGDNRHGRAVATLSRLRAVHLIGVSVTDEGLQPLAKMPQLESLYLDDTAVTDLGWTWLFQNNPQLHVHIDQRHHDRDPLKH
jgi:hypothetical protein